MSHPAPPPPQTRALLSRQPFAQLWSDSLDLRSLALMRVLLGALLTVHLLAALPDAAALWSDGGVLPRARLLDIAPATLFSLWLANGSVLFTIAMLVAQLVLALLLLFGWRSRAMAGAGFLLWISLSARNPAASVQSDVLIAWLLFWSSLLPVGARYGIDAALQAAPATPAQWQSPLASLARLFWISAFAFSALTDPGIGLPVLTLTCLAAGLLLLPLPARASRVARALGALCLLLPLLALLARAPLSAAGWTALAGFILLLDTSLWDRSWRWRSRPAARGEARPLHIYYDGDCRFCARGVRLLATALIVPDAICQPAQSQPRARMLMEANDSWVVIDSAEEAHLRWDAFVVLLRASALLGPLASLTARLLARPGMTAIGERLYTAVVRHRGHLGRLSGWMDRGETNPADSTNGAQTRWPLWLAASVVVLSIAAQASQAGWLPVTWRASIAAPLQLAGIGSQWQHALTALPAESGWLLISGQRADGVEVDVLRPWQAAVQIAPPRNAAARDGVYWRRYRTALLDDRRHALRASYGDYLCRDWNRHADGDQALLRLRMIALQSSSISGANGPALEQRELLRHACP